MTEAERIDCLKMVLALKEKTFGRLATIRSLSESELQEMIIELDKESEALQGMMVALKADDERKQVK